MENFTIGLASGLFTWFFTWGMYSTFLFIRKLFN